jgi:hypothetical protein
MRRTALLIVGTAVVVVASLLSPSLARVDAADEVPGGVGIEAQFAALVSLVDALDEKKLDHRLDKVATALAKGDLRKARQELDEFAKKVQQAARQGRLTTDEAGPLLEGSLRLAEALKALSLFIDCGDCSVQAGRSLSLIGDSSAGRLRYHRWSWTDASGVTIVVNRDTAGSAYRSSAVFSADGFSGVASRAVSLTACDAGYALGDCVTRVQTVTVFPAPSPTIACSLLACTVNAGNTMSLHGDSSAAQFRYHRWRWTDAAGVTVTALRDSGGGFVSDVLFSAVGFDGEAASHVVVQLEACTRGYGVGSCASGSAPITVAPALPATIACADGPCTVQAGSTLGITGDSTASGFRYHTWRWQNSSGVSIVTQIDSGVPRTSTVVFSADGFNGANSRIVSLTTCSSGYGAGTCVTATETILIKAAPAPTITCSLVDCTVGVGTTMNLHGDSSAAQFRYHRWRWTNAAGVAVTVQRDSGDGFVSDVVFSAAGFGERTEVPVELTACRSGYDLGSCSRGMVTVTVVSQLPHPK